MNPRQQLKLLRERRKLSCAALARHLGCSRQFVEAVEKDIDGKIPGIALADRIEKFLGLPAKRWNALVKVKRYRPRKRVAG